MYFPALFAYHPLRCYATFASICARVQDLEAPASSTVEHMAAPMIARTMDHEVIPFGISHSPRVQPWTLEIEVEEDKRRDEADGT